MALVSRNWRALVWWKGARGVHLLIFKSFPGFFAQQVPTSPRMVRFSRGFSVFGGARVRKVSGPAGPWRGAAMLGPRFAGRFQGGTGALLWFTCARPITTSRIGSATGRRRLHPGAGARHLVHLLVPPPGFGLLSRAVRGGWSIPLGGPCPGLLALWVPFRLPTAFRNAQPITLPFGMEPPICLVCSGTSRSGRSPAARA